MLQVSENKVSYFFKIVKMEEYPKIHLFAKIHKKSFFQKSNNILIVITYKSKEFLNQGIFKKALEFRFFGLTYY